MEKLLRIKKLYDEILILEDNVTSMEDAMLITNNYFELEELEKYFEKIMLDEELLIFFDKSNYIFINISKNEQTKKIEVEEEKGKVFITIFNEETNIKQITRKKFNEIIQIKIFEVKSKNKLDFYNLYNKINFINIKKESEDVKSFKLFYKNNLINKKMEALKEITQKTKFRFDEVVSEYNNFINNNIDLSKFNDTEKHLNNDISNYLFLYKEFKNMEKGN